MALTTNRELWKIMIGIFIALTLMFTAFFYFSTIFITFIVGLSLIIITNRLRQDYVIKMKAYGYSDLKMKVYGVALFIFWVINILAFTKGFFHPTFKILLYLFSSAVFIWLYLRVHKRLQGDAKKKRQA